MSIIFNDGYEENGIIFNEWSFKMNFQEAFDLMQKGEYLTRKSWETEGPNSGFCVIMPDMTQIWRIITKPVPNAGVYMLPIADLLAEDWYVRDRNHVPHVVIEPEIEEVAAA